MWRIILVFFTIVIASGERASAQETFPLPAVPDSILTPGDRANFIVAHFWDNAPLDKINPENLEEAKPVIEQSFADFLSIINLANDASREAGVKALLSKTAYLEDLSLFILNISEKYLYSLDSPMRDDDTFIFFLNLIINSEEIDDSLKLRPQMLLEYALINKPGTKANDFTFIDRNGKESSLYETVSANDLMLVFYDPDCGHCKDVFEKLKHKNDVSVPALSDDLTILAIYSGENKESWNKTKFELPEEWIVGYDDGSIEDEDIYIIRSMPSVYILDSNKIVKAKEVQF